MLDELRKPFFIIALVLMLIVVLVEVGSALWISSTSEAAGKLNADTPGYGIIYLSFLDGLVFYITLLMGLALLIPERIQGRVQPR